ncbi:tRNA adenine-34 [Nymphaea thermarum]|nr:tRNA adenine-34 [Nymphaea thermarum]
MYHAHYRSTLTVRDRTAFVPWYSEFRYSHGKGRLLESACACGHASVSWPSGCGLRQSTLIHRSPVRRPVFLGGCARCRWQFDGHLPFRPGGGGGPGKIVARAMKGEGFGGQQEFDYGVELHNWAQETVSLLMKFEGGISPGSGESKGHHNEFSLLLRDHNHADEYETSFKFGQCSFCEEANINVNGATENVDMVVEGRNRASSFRYLCDDKEWEDDGFCQERGTMLCSHSSSLKRQQRKHELRHEFSLRGKHSASDPKETQKHDFTETESTPPRARGRHSVTVAASDKHESTVGASSDGIARGKQHKFLRDGRYSNEERSKRQEISGYVQHFPKSDEIKVCLVDKQKKISSSSTLVSRHEEQISKRVDDSKVENRNVAGECSVSAGRCSSSYWAPQLHVDANGKPRQRNEIRSSDNVTESVTVVSDARYASRKDQRVFVDETEEVSTSLNNSAGTSRQNKEKVVGVAWNHVPQQMDSSVIILDSDMSRLHESKEYVDKNYRSSDIDYLQQTSTSRAHSSARLYQDQISVQKMPTTSSSEPPIGISLNISSGHQTAEYTASDYISQYQHHSNVNYTQELSSNSTQTGARISEALRLQDQPRSHPSQWATKISMGNTRAHQSDGYTTTQYVAARHDLECHQESRDNNTRIGATDSGQADQPEISVLSYPQSVNTGSLSGSSGYQLAGYASNDDIAKHRSSVNVNYNDTQIDTTLSRPIILHEPPADLSSPSTLSDSPRTAGEHQPTTNTPLQINSDVIHVRQQGEVPPDHPEPNDIVKQCSEPPTESGCSRPIILIEKSSDGSRHPSTGNLHPANLPSERIVEETEKTYIVERERSSHQTTTSFQQLVLFNPPPNSNADTVQGNSRKNVFEDSEMQRSRQSSVLSEADEQSDEIWAIARETLEEHSNMVKTPETMITPVISGSGAQLTELISTVGTTEGTQAASLGSPTAKRPSRKHWGYVAEIIKSGWILRAGTHNSKSKSAAKSSLTESGSNEAWFSGHEPVGEESPRKEKEAMPEEPGGDEGSADALISAASANANNRQDITDDRSSPSMLADSKPDTSSPIGLPAHVSIQEEASSISDNQMLGSATNYASIGSLSMSVSGTVSPVVIACSTGIHDVQQQEKISVQPVISPKVGRKNLDSGSHEPSVQDRPEKDASNEDKKRALGSRKLRRAAQVQRERFEAWEDAYRLENEQRKMDEMFMREAIAEARKAADIWEVPVGAVLVQDGKIIARGHNLVEDLRDSTAHAEMLCIRGASRMLRTWRLAETTLYVTLEPCPMCAGAILQARIGTLVWGAPNKLLGADGSWVRCARVSQP